MPRPPKYAPEVEQQVVELYQELRNTEMVGERMGIPTSTVWRILKRHKVETAKRGTNPKNCAPPGTRPGGRQKGTTNRDVSELRRLILQEWDQNDFRKWKKEKPSEYFTLIGKLLPKGISVRSIKSVDDLDPTELSSLISEIETELKRRKSKGILH
jgi:hypothetical protein